MEIAEYLARLKARRAHYDSLIAGIEADLASQAEGGDSGIAEPAPSNPLVTAGPMPVIHADTFFGHNIMEAAKKYLGMIRRAQPAAAIADALARGGLRRPDDGTLRSLLARAAKGRVVVRVGKGMWGLAEWYPPKASKDGNGEPSRKGNKPGRKRKPVVVKNHRTDASLKKPQELLAPPVSTDANNGSGGGPLSPMMLDVLREAGKPLHAKEVTSRVNARGNTATRATVEALLRRWVTKGKAKQTGPSTFALPAGSPG